MALKRKLNADEYKKLSADLKKEYTADGDDWKLDVEPGDDDDDDDDDENNPAALRRARDRERADAKAAKREAAALKTRLDKLEAGRTGKDTDIEKLEGEYKEKLDEAEAATKTAKDAANKRIADLLIKNASEAMASEISTLPKLLAKEIRDRLTVEFDDDGEPELIVKNSKGKVSDMSLEQLKKEFLQNKDFANILIGSKASGGSAPRQATEKKPGSAGASDEPQAPADLSKMKPSQLAAHLKAKKAATSEAQ